MRSSSIIIALCAMAMSIAIQCAQANPRFANEQGRAVHMLNQQALALTDEWIIELKNPSSLSLKQTSKYMHTSAQKQNLQAYQQTLLQQQQSVLDVAQSSGLIKRVIKHITYSSNVIIVQAHKSGLSSLSQHPLVKAIHQVRNYQPALLNSTQRIGADLVWSQRDRNELSITGQGITVAVLDTGIDYTHQALGGCFGPQCKVIGGYDIINDDPDPLESQADPEHFYRGHGTHVAGIIAAQATHDQPARRGVAPDAKLLAYKVCDPLCSTADILQGLDMAANPDGDANTNDAANIINLSIGSRYGDANDILPSTINTLVDSGISVVVAAGNDGGIANIGDIAAAEKAITVAATGNLHSQGTNSEGVMPFSSRGPLQNAQYLKPEISAPGSNITAPCITNDTDKNLWCSRSGTSMASPHVAGVAALIKQKYPSMSPATLKSLILSNADSLHIDAAAQGAGMLDAFAAVNSNVVFSKPNLYFGDYPSAQNTWQVEMSTQVTNTAEQAQDIAVSMLDNPPQGVQFNLLSESEFILDVGQTKNIQIQLHVDANQFDPTQLTQLTISQYMQVSTAKKHYTIPLVFTRMRNLLLDSGNQRPTTIALYNTYNASEYFSEVQSGAYYLPIGKYRAFTSFTDDSDYRVVFSEDIDLRTQQQFSVDAQSAKHEFKIEYIQSAKGGLIDIDALNGIPVYAELTDIDAGFHELFGYERLHNLDFYTHKVWFSDMPEAIVFRMTAAFAQSNTEAPLDANYYVLNDKQAGITSGHAYKIQLDDFIHQQITLDHHVFDTQGDVIIPTIETSVRKRADINSTVFGVANQLDGFALTALGALAQVTGSDEQAVASRRPVVNLYAIPPQDNTPDNMGALSLNMQYVDTPSDGNQYSALFSDAMLLDDSKLHLYPTFTTPLIIPLGAALTDTLTQTQIHHNITVQDLANGTQQMNGDVFQHSIFAKSLVHTQADEVHSRLSCEGETLAEAGVSINFQYSCERPRVDFTFPVYLHDAHYQAHFSAEFKQDNAQATVEQADIDLVPQLINMYSTSGGSLNFSPSTDDSRLHIVTSSNTNAESLQVWLKTDGAWQTLVLEPVSQDDQQQHFSTLLPMPERARVAHLRVSMQDQDSDLVTYEYPAFMIVGDQQDDIFSVDDDGDGVPNYKDHDNDDDNEPDLSDDFPFDASETLDTDSDGVGNNADSDDDNDGVNDSDDAFPLDASEALDTDADGIGNNADNDDDGDGVNDDEDAYPLDPNRTQLPVEPTPPATSDSGGGSVYWLLIGLILTLCRRIKYLWCRELTLS